MEGWDHKVSATKDEMKEIVENSKRVADALGSFRITATESDEKKREFDVVTVLTFVVQFSLQLVKAWNLSQSCQSYMSHAAGQPLSYLRLKFHRHD